MAPAPPREVAVPCVPWADLKAGCDKAPSPGWERAVSTIEAAYGPGGLGAVCVSGVPGAAEARRGLLLLAPRLASLGERSLSALEDPESSYMFGWSHGREALEGGAPDTRKGSFYANPLTEQPEATGAELEAHPAYCRPNLWPRDDELPELRPAFLALGGLLVSVGARVAAACDAATERRTGAPPPVPLERVVRESPCPKGRLLHYFPAEGGGAAEGGVSGWCGWHRDHGSLTGLAAGLYTGPGGEEAPNPDPMSGLHVRTRSGEVVRAVFPADCLAFQLGEAGQVHSGGLLQATPHCVRAAGGPGAAGVARNSFAVFMQPRWDVPMEPPAGCADKSKVGVPAWEPGQDFGTFTARKLEAYYGAAAAS